MFGSINRYQDREVRYAYGLALARGDKKLAENIRKNHPDLSKEFDKEDKEREVSVGS